MGVGTAAPTGRLDCQRTMRLISNDYSDMSGTLEGHNAVLCEGPLQSEWSGGSLLLIVG